jgi:HD-GYP domain-containing protein (c-di-GMP phosphodiesterase class II)
MTDGRETPPGFVQLDLNLLQIDKPVEFDIYIWPETSLRPVLYRGGHMPFGEDHRERLSRRGPFVAFARVESAGALDDYIEHNLDRIIANPNVRTADKAKLLYDTSLRLAAGILSEPGTKESLERSEDLVRNTISYVLLGKDAFHELLELKAYDYRTYTHSVNVCAIGLALAQRVGFESRTELADFGLGAIFHDVGKTRISHDLLTKSGPLNDNEWQLMRQHPRMGLDLIAPHIDFPPDGRAVVAQHHERLDGSGYPDGLKGEEIHPYAKVAAIADVFDALTSSRPYKDAVDSFPALQDMKGDVGAHFHEGYFQEFVRLLGR